jgi:hypothetical protein
VKTKNSDDTSKQSQPNTKLVWFDFHHETKGGWQNLSKLLAEVNQDFPLVGFFSSSEIDMKKLKEQTGCFRVNCMDNLDRTNVVQSILARRSALDQFSYVSGARLKMPENVFDCGFPEFEKAFKEIWADNADAVSLVYAGSNALKTDFTRYGKRGRFGPLQDAMNSITRMFVNNLFDWYRQDQFDVLLKDDNTVHRAISLGYMNGSQAWTPLKRKLGLLAVGAFGLFTPLAQEHQTSYTILLMSFATWIIYKQSKEKPKFVEMKRKGSNSFSNSSDSIRT